MWLSTASSDIGIDTFMLVDLSMPSKPKDLQASLSFLIQCEMKPDVNPAKGKTILEAVTKPVTVSVKVL